MLCTLNDMIDIVIPARLNSKRFPKKLLIKIDGKNILEHLIIKLKKLDLPAKIHVLSDSLEIIESINTYQNQVNLIYNDKKASNGTERICQKLENFTHDYILNIQADEGLSELSFLKEFIDTWMKEKTNILTPVFKLSSLHHLHDKNCVKVAIDNQQKALYFSRQAIPYLRDEPESEWLLKQAYWGHMGIYAYQKKHLESYKNSQSNYLEDQEKLEQLRFMSLGIPVKCFEINADNIKSVDCKEDILKKSKMIDLAKDTLIYESLAIKKILPQINQNFLTAVHTINQNKHHLIFSGLGKSALVAKKICASFNSISVKSLFIDPVDAFHGDLGMLEDESVCLLFSNSGKTQEILDLAIQLKKRNCYCIALTGQESSALEKICDQNLNLDIHHEADPLNLVPTNSTTVTLALGDAILSALIELRKIKEQDFLKNHSSGTLGHLLQPISSRMLPLKTLHSIKANANIQEISEKINQNKLGAILVLNEHKELMGLITDGDIRRIQKSKDNNLKAIDIMSKEPISIQKDVNLREAISLMQNRESEISILPVIENKKLCGLIRLHDIIGKI